MKAYTILMSVGDPIQLDQDELPKVLTAIQKKQPCLVRQGLFNPSFYVTIREDDKRLSEFRRELFDVQKHNKQDSSYYGGKNQKPTPELKPLKDIFSGVQLKLASGDK